MAEYGYPVKLPRETYEYVYKLGQKYGNVAEKYLSAFLDGNSPDDMGYYYEGEDVRTMFDSYKTDLVEQLWVSVLQIRYRYDVVSNKFSVEFDASLPGGRAHTTNPIPVNPEVILSNIALLASKDITPGGCGGAWSCPEYGIKDEGAYDYEPTHPIYTPQILQQIEDEHSLILNKHKKDSKHEAEETDLEQSVAEEIAADWTEEMTSSDQSLVSSHTQTRASIHLQHMLSSLPQAKL